MMLISYIDKKKSGKKNIIALTTMHDKVKVTNDQRCKLHVLVMYDHTKGGVDVVDLISTRHSTRIKSKWWPLNAFPLILDTVWTNAKTILAENKSSFSNFQFTYQLGKALVLQLFSGDIKSGTVFKLQSWRKSGVYLELLNWIHNLSLKLL